MKQIISSELLSQVDKNETPISWLYKTIFYDNKWNWYVVIIMGYFGSGLMIVWSILFDEVIDFEYVLIDLFIIMFSVFYLFFRGKIFLKIYSKELYLNHYYDNE